MQKGFDGEQVYDEKHLKIEVKLGKTNGGKINTNFDDNGIHKESSYCVFLKVLLTDSVVKIDKNSYSQIFQEECKYVIKENMMIKFINDELEISSEVSHEKKL